MSLFNWFQSENAVLRVEEPRENPLAQAIQKHTPLPTLMPVLSKIQYQSVNLIKSICCETPNQQIALGKPVARLDDAPAPNLELDDAMLTRMPSSIGGIPQNKNACLDEEGIQIAILYMKLNCDQCSECHIALESSHVKLEVVDVGWDDGWKEAVNMCRNVDKFYWPGPPLKLPVVMIGNAVWWDVKISDAWALALEVRRRQLGEENQPDAHKKKYEVLLHDKQLKTAKQKILVDEIPVERIGDAKRRTRHHVKDPKISVGVGLVIGREGLERGNPQILRVMEGGGAADVGVICNGDRLVGTRDTLFASMELADIKRTLLGQEGTSVELIIQAPHDSQHHSVVVRRKRITGA